MLKIKKPRAFKWLDLTIVSVLGVLGGVYIYQPLLKRNKIEQEKSNQVNSEKGDIS